MKHIACSLSKSILYRQKLAISLWRDTWKGQYIVTCNTSKTISCLKPSEKSWDFLHCY